MPPATLMGALSENCNNYRSKCFKWEICHNYRNKCLGVKLWSKMKVENLHIYRYICLRRHLWVYYGRYLRCFCEYGYDVSRFMAVFCSAFLRDSTGH